MRCKKTSPSWRKDKTNIEENKYKGEIQMSDPKDFVIENGVLMEYNGKDADVEIPTKTKMIRHGIFEGRDDILSVVIPDSVTGIGGHAFAYCTNLKTVKMSMGITVVGYDAFENCSSLTQIDFKSFMLGSYEHAFRGCDNLEDLIFPEDDGEFQILFRTYGHSISEPVQKIFLLASLLEKKFDFVKSDDSLVRKMKANKVKLVNFAAKVNKSVIIENLFSLYDKIKLEELNEYIDDFNESATIAAFLLDYKARIYSPEEQEKYENEKTEKELGLKELTLEDWKKKFELKFYDETVTIKRYKGREKTLVIPEEINNHKVDSIVSLGGRGLSCVYIPDSVTQISDSCFDDCREMADEDGFLIIHKKLYNCFSTEEEITVPDDVKEIGNQAFVNCTSVKTINIPESVISIGGKAFRNCTDLVTINIMKNEA